MKRLFKKLTIGVLSLSMLVAPASVFANEIISNINDNNISPLYERPINITVHNGQTVYFNNLETGQPFYIREGSNISLVLRFLNQHRYFDCGIVDENNQIILSSEFNTFTSTPQTIWGEKISKTGRYKVYFTNYNLDSVTLTSLDLSLMN